MGKAGTYKQIRKRAAMIPPVEVKGKLVNHYRKMKDLYMKGGLDACNAYIHAANRYITAIKAKQESENNEKPNE